jgi:hypothetical protein
MIKPGGAPVWGPLVEPWSHRNLDKYSLIFELKASAKMMDKTLNTRAMFSKSRRHRLVLHGTMQRPEYAGASALLVYPARPG